MRGVDFAWGVVPGRERELARALAAQGFGFVVRYLSAVDPTKNLTAAEVQAYRAEGLLIVTVYEDAATWMLGGSQAGTAAAETARRELAALGAPAHAPVYFADDFQITAGQIAVIDACLDATAAVLTQARNGIYGPLAAVTQARHVAYRWQTAAWSAGQWLPGDNLRQYATGGVTDGVRWDLDEAMTPDFGQWEWAEQWADYVTTGRESLVQIAAACDPPVGASTILRVTVEADRFFAPHLAGYVSAGNLTAPMPRGIVLRVPGSVSIPSRKRRARRAALAVAGAARSGAAATGTAVRAEPVMSAGLSAGLLSAALVLAGHLGYLHLTAAQSGAVLTAITAAAGAAAAAMTRPVRLGAVTAALSALAVAAGAFGLHLPAAWIGYQMPVASLLVGLILRLHVSPKESPAKAAAPGSVMLPTLTQRFEADFGQVHTALDKVLAHARQAAGAVDAVTPAVPQNTMSGAVTVQAAGPVPGAAPMPPVQILAVTGGTATAQAVPPPAGPAPPAVA